LPDPAYYVGTAFLLVLLRLYPDQSADSIVAKLTLYATEVFQLMGLSPTVAKQRVTQENILVESAVVPLLGYSSRCL
jgi:hypothetical protein